VIIIAFIAQWLTESCTQFWLSQAPEVGKENKKLAQGHIASTWQNWDISRGPWSPKLFHYSLLSLSQTLIPQQCLAQCWEKIGCSKNRLLCWPCQIFIWLPICHLSQPALLVMNHEHVWGRVCFFRPHQVMKAVVVVGGWD
jgi:hypothetical protein